MGALRVYVRIFITLIPIVWTGFSESESESESD